MPVPQNSAICVRPKRPDDELVDISPSHMISVATSPANGRLPRKEVIQPQLPLRLPCYDFTPVTNPTFDGCLPCGLAHRLRALPASVV